jgi:hypothetical protein
VAREERERREFAQPRRHDPAARGELQRAHGDGGLALQARQQHPRGDELRADGAALRGAQRALRRGVAADEPRLRHGRPRRARGADLRTVDKAGISPVWLAVRHGRVRVLLCLLHHGALPSPGPAAIGLILFAMLGFLALVLFALGVVHVRL